MCEIPEAASWGIRDCDIRILKARLADLRAAESIYVLVNIGALSRGDIDDASFSLQVVPSCTLVFHVNHSEPPLDAEGRIDWEDVYRIKLVEIKR